MIAIFLESQELPLLLAANFRRGPNAFEINLFAVTLDVSEKEVVYKLHSPEEIHHQANCKRGCKFACYLHLLLYVCEEDLLEIISKLTNAVHFSTLMGRGDFCNSIMPLV